MKNITNITPHDTDDSQTVGESISNSTIARHSLVSSSSSLLPRILSGSIGSIVTALVVTPLEVVKIRQQSAGLQDSIKQSYNHDVAGNATQWKIEPCPRGCTVVLNNGLMECSVPKSSIPCLDSVVTSNFSRTFNSSSQSFVPKYGGTFQALMTIFHYEGWAGLYAGLRPTLLMSIPNTVLYFTVYDEISSMLYRNHASKQMMEIDLRNSDEFISGRDFRDLERQGYIPLVAGSAARLLATLAIAPLELIRTQQAGIFPVNVGRDKLHVDMGLMEDLHNLRKTKGLSALYTGLAPTLWRDVPFSAIYWLCLERFRTELFNLESLGKWGGRYYEEQGTKVPPGIDALHAFISGAAAGTIAAAFTTPFDVVKTRRQMAHIESGVQPVLTSAFGYGRIDLGTFGHLHQIVKYEGVSGLWKGNLTRMIKIAPACAIMISCYEFGKRIFGDVL